MGIEIQQAIAPQLAPLSLVGSSYTVHGGPALLQTVRKLNHDPNMTRYKGKQSAKYVEKDFPHFVDMVVPPDGFGNRLDTMYGFHDRHGIEAKRGHGWRDQKKGRNYIRWCFADRAIAAAFAREFKA